MVNGVPVDVVNVVNYELWQDREQCGVIKRHSPDVEPLVELEMVETEGEQVEEFKDFFRKKSVDARVKRSLTTLTVSA